MTPKPGASPFEDFREAVKQLRTIAAAMEVASRHIDDASADTHAAQAATRRLEAELLARLERLEAQQRREEMPPRRGRRKQEIREETRRKVRVILARNPKAGWGAIADATGLSEWVAKRVLREERGRKLGQSMGGNPSHPEGRR